MKTLIHTLHRRCNVHVPFDLDMIQRSCVCVCPEVHIVTYTDVFCWLRVR